MKWMGGWDWHTYAAQPAYVVAEILDLMREEAKAATDARKRSPGGPSSPGGHQGYAQRPGAKSAARVRVETP
jgi:hypothetical protein